MAPISGSEDQNGRVRSGSCARTETKRLIHLSKQTNVLIRSNVGSEGTTRPFRVYEFKFIPVVSQKGRSPHLEFVKRNCDMI